MSTPTKANKEIDKATDRADKLLSLKALKTSKVPDKKDHFQHREKEKAFKKRYGKDVLISVTYEMNGPEIKEYTLRFQSPNNKVYSLTEELEGGLTKKVILCFRNGGRNFEHNFDKFLDAEVMLADKMSEEE